MSTPALATPPPVVLTIAGFDPSSGAGITADLQVFSAHGLFGVSCPTALTVQSTVGVRSSNPLDPDLLREMLDCLVEDVTLAGIKIGMLANAAICGVVADFVDQLRTNSSIPIVLDPIVRSSSGHLLLEPEALAILRDRLLPKLTCVTPNRHELAVLLGRKDIMAIDAERAGASLLRLTPTVLLTGGDEVLPTDLLLQRQVPLTRIGGSHIETRSTHGTGCAHSSALLSHLVLGKPLAAAAVAAKRYVEGALAHAPGLGRGRGPLQFNWCARL